MDSWRCKPISNQGNNQQEKTAGMPLYPQNVQHLRVESGDDANGIASRYRTSKSKG